MLLHAARFPAHAPGQLDISLMVRLWCVVTSLRLISGCHTESPPSPFPADPRACPRRSPWERCSYMYFECPRRWPNGRGGLDRRRGGVWEQWRRGGRTRAVAPADLLPRHLLRLMYVQRVPGRAAYPWTGPARNGSARQKCTAVTVMCSQSQQTELPPLPLSQPPGARTGMPRWSNHVAATSA